jgi:CHAD domain-containing protein
VRLLALLQKIPDQAGKKEIHLLRTSVRRLEAQLNEPPAKVAKALKRLRRKAGRVRDVDVHLDLLKTPPAAKGSRTVAAQEQWQTLRKILKEQRAEQLESLRAVVKDSTGVLLKRLPALAEAASAVEPKADEAHQRSEQARERYQRWSRTIPSDAEHFHQLRIDTKHLRYTLEPLENFEEAAELVGRLKEVQDAIGNWHDWATLHELAEESLDPAAAAPVCQALRARANREYRKARRTAEAVRNWMSGRKPVASVHELDGERDLVTHSNVTPIDATPSQQVG